MGDGTSKVEILYVTFQLEESSFNALRYDLDTTSWRTELIRLHPAKCAADVIVGQHGAGDYGQSGGRQNLQKCGDYRGATDALSSEVELTVLLDGEAIELPYTLNHLEMEPGEHTLT